MKEYNCNAILTRLTDVESGWCQTPPGSWFSSFFFLGSSRQSPDLRLPGISTQVLMAIPSQFFCPQNAIFWNSRDLTYTSLVVFYSSSQSPLPKHALMWKPQETWFSCSGEGVLQSAWGQVWENGLRIALSKRPAAASGSFYRVLLVRAGLGAFHLSFPALCPGLLSLLS